MDDGTTENRPAPARSQAASNAARLARFASASSVTAATSWKELLGVGLLVAIADVTVYRGQGFAGLALLFAAAPLLLRLAAPGPCRGIAYGTVTVMLWLLAARMLWFGSPLRAFEGFVLLAAAAVALGGPSPYAALVGVMPIQAFPAGVMAMAVLGPRLWERWQSAVPRVPRPRWASVLFPLAAVAAFGMLFVMANPDLETLFQFRFRQGWNALVEWLTQWTWHPSEWLFWCFTACLVLGLLRPLVRIAQYDAWFGPPSACKPGPAEMFGACRNTLLAVIGLFAVYLVFEFATLWFRDFPPGFYYAGYAHEGAAWLTAALALATAILSLIFRGPILADPRRRQLQTLAWVWSAQNFLLAVAVYHRLFIYIGFNGMTRMRIVGLFGISAVVLGLGLVVLKIARDKSTRWLLERQIWALGATIFCFSLTPVDYLAVRYNVGRVLNGDRAACMQIGVQPLDLEGVLALPPLLDCPDAEIREGVKAILAQRYQALVETEQANRRAGWTSLQLARRRALARLRPRRREWSSYQDAFRRQQRLARFYNYAYQWY